MNLSQKVMVISGIAYIFMTIGWLLFGLVGGNDEDKYEPLYIRGHGNKQYTGIYDPSVEFVSPTSLHGWLAYTVVEKARKDEEPRIGVHLAATYDAGKSWKTANLAFESRAGEISSATSLATIKKGIWRYEMPSLVYDPDDKGREWKIYAYRYFWSGDIKSARQYGAISYRYATEPRRAWSEDVWLFSANNQQPPYPYNSFVELHLNDLDPSLKDIKYYADPGAIYKNGAILMALSAYTEEDYPDRIIMIASLDHGKSWVFVNTLITKEQIQKMGNYTHASGASLVEKKNELYLMLSLGNEKTPNQGTSVFAFEKWQKGRLLLDNKGIPKVINKIDLPEWADVSFGGGHSDYHEAIAKENGVLMPISIPSKAGSHFQILSTRQDLLGDDD